MSRRLAAPAVAIKRLRLPAALRLPVGCAALTLAIGLVLYVFGPPGVDRAAHVYHTAQFEQHGWQVWNNYWYAGRYELLNYSILFYPLAAVAGIGTRGAGRASRPARRCSPRSSSPSRRAAAVLAGSWRSPSRGRRSLLAGQYPFALGAAFAMGALVALVRHRALTALALVALTAPDAARSRSCC